MPGTVHNIIPDSCELLGTVRTLSPDVRAQAEAAIRPAMRGQRCRFPHNDRAALGFPAYRRR